MTHDLEGDGLDAGSVRGVTTAATLGVARHAATADASRRTSRFHKKERKQNMNLLFGGGAAAAERDDNLRMTGAF